jgi:hypothetical protein
MWCWLPKRLAVNHGNQSSILIVTYTTHYNTYVHGRVGQGKVYIEFYELIIIVLLIR